MSQNPYEVYQWLPLMLKAHKVLKVDKHSECYIIKYEVTSSSRGGSDYRRVRTWGMDLLTHFYTLTHLSVCFYRHFLMLPYLLGSSAFFYLY